LRRAADPGAQSPSRHGGGRCFSLPDKPDMERQTTGKRGRKPVALFGDLFLSVGAMKAGTTWLAQMLRQHPELHFTLEKEIHYFYHRYVDPQFLSNKRRLTETKNRYIRAFDPSTSNPDAVRQNLRWVSAYLDSPIGDFWFANLFFRGKHPQRYNCDFSNLNAHVPAEAWPRIARRAGALKVLYTMRDPVKRLWSHTKFHLQITGQIEKLDEWGHKDFERFVKQEHIWQNAEYGRVLRSLREGLPKTDSLKVMFYEDIHADQRAALAELEDFLGIAHHAYPEKLLERRFTQSVKHEMPAFFPEILAKDVARIRAEVEAEGYKIPAKWG